MRYFRYFLTIILIVAAFFIVYSKFKNVYYDIPLLLKEANKSFLVFLVIFQIINYLGDAWLSQILLVIAGFKVSFKNTLKIAILGVVGNHVAPFVGGTMITFYSYKKLSIPSAVISFLVFSWSIFVWLIYLLFFLLSLLLLPGLFFNFISPKSVFIAFFALILISFFLFILFRKRGKRLIWFLNIFSKPRTKVTNFLSNRKLSRPKLVEKFISDFHQCLDFLWKRKNKIPQALFSSLLFYLGDIVTFYFAFLIFGFRPDPALLIFGYTLSLVLTLFTLMPGTPGIMEASLMVVFIKLGLPAHVVLLATLLFRLFSYWLPLPAAIISYWRLKKANPEENNSLKNSGQN